MYLEEKNVGFGKAIKNSVENGIFVKKGKESWRNPHWSKNTKYETFALYCHVVHLYFRHWIIFHYLKHFPIARWWFEKSPLSVLERYVSKHFF